MTSEAVECADCGATMVPGADGRTYACAYCSAKVLVGIDGSQIARNMALDLSNAEAFLKKLAIELTTAFPGCTKIQTNGIHVAVVEVTLGNDLFVAKNAGRSITSQHKRLVRGVALKTTTHPLDRWVELLTEAMAEHANETTRAGAALKGR